MIPEVGQDYDINVTDARPDTGGLSGAPPSEAASWGKIDPTKLDEAVTAAVKLSSRYISGRFLPDKAVDLIDTSCARVAVSLTTRPGKLDDYERDDRDQE